MAPPQRVAILVWMVVATTHANCGYDTVTALPGQNLQWGALHAGYATETATDCLEACCDDAECGGYTWTSYQPPYQPPLPLPTSSRPRVSNACPTGARCCWLKRWENNPNAKAPKPNCTSGIVKHLGPSPPGPHPGPPSPAPKDRPDGVPAEPDCAMRELAVGATPSLSLSLGAHGWDLCAPILTPTSTATHWTDWQAAVLGVGEGGVGVRVAVRWVGWHCGSEAYPHHHRRRQLPPLPLTHTQWQAVVLGSCEGGEVFVCVWG